MFIVAYFAVVVELMLSYVRIRLFIPNVCNSFTPVDYQILETLVVVSTVWKRILYNRGQLFQAKLRLTLG